MSNPPSSSQRLGAWIFPGAIAIVVAVALHEGSGQRGERTAGPDGGASMLEARALIRERYVQPLEDSKVDRGAIQGMTKILDPYSTFIPPKEVDHFRTETTGKFGGLGIIITLERGLVRVIAPLESTPAWNAGVQPGDVIVRIDGKAYEFETVQDAADNLKGVPGTLIALELQRQGVEHPIPVEIERAIIVVRSVKGARIVDPDAGIGYLRVTSFQDDTVAHVAESIARLREQGLRGLVLDLRSNPGGMLDASVELANLFVADGPIVETRGRDPIADRRVFLANPANVLDADIPLAVLIDGGSASASEIAAGALRDHGRAVLIGARTFGKGSVQTIFDLEDGLSVLKLTTASYYTPSGRSIHRREGMGPEDEWGLVPDVEAPVEPATLRQIFAWQEDEEIRRLREQAGRSGLDRPTSDPDLVLQTVPLVGEVVRLLDDATAAPADPPVDPALDAALTDLRGKLEKKQ